MRVSRNYMLMIRKLSSFTLSVCISLTSLKHYKNQRVVNVNGKKEGNTRGKKKVTPEEKEKVTPEEKEKVTPEGERR